MANETLRPKGATMNRRLHQTGLGVILAAILCAALSGVASAATGVAWDVRSSAHTTAAPGSSLSFLVWTGNLGDTATDGRTPITLDVTLPRGMTLLAATPIVGPPDWNCAGAGVGDREFSCTSLDVVEPIAAFTGFANLMITVSVDADTSVSAGLRTVRYDLHGGHGDATARTSYDPTIVTSDPPAFGIDGFDAVVTGLDGDAFPQAGGRPALATTYIDFTRGEDPIRGALWPTAPVKDVIVDLPPGFLGDPGALPRCSQEDLANGDTQPRPLCPPGSQVGVASIDVNRGFGNVDQVVGPLPVFNMEPRAGVPATFGFNMSGTVVLLDARVRSGSDYGVSIDVKNTPDALAIIGTEITFWGVPGDEAHDAQRACPGELAPYVEGPTCATGLPKTAFLRNPTSCAAPAGSPVGDGLVTRLSVSSWFKPARFNADGSPDLSDPAWKSREIVSHDNPGYPANPDDPSTPWGAHLLPTGCDAVPFDPALKGRPTSPAAVSSPAAFSFDLTLPQDDTPGTIAQSDLRKAVVTLPAGVRVSPSSAHGLAGCSQAQIKLHSTEPPACPAASKIGTVTIDTPLLDAPLTGAIYLAAPHDNPFGNLLTIYLTASGSGVVIKLAGRIDADPDSGQITATFDDNPQLPFEKLNLQFKGGPRAPLVTPDLCGTYAIDAVFTSWSGATVPSRSTFKVSADGKGGACPATRRFSPDMHAGSESPVAGASSPLLVTFRRDDVDQQLGSITVEMPRGLLGRIKNATLCSADDARRGRCAAESRIGSVTVGAGAGTNPFYITNGRAYITEGYRGGEFGLSIVVPAVAGPFDLGEVNVRAAIHVDKRTAQLRVVSDPLPTILQGIPLDVRDVRVKIDKDDFIVNPTNCRAQTVNGTLRSTTGATAKRSTHFQMAGCAGLQLQPRVTVAVGRRGRTQRGRSTPLTTIIRQSPGQSNLKSVAVTLPLTLNARLDVVNNACTLEEYQAGDCERARAGTATAWTPLLAKPLRGGAYFVRNGRPLPDLVIGLRGQVAIDLFGKVRIPGGKRLATRFDTIPDAPISKFKLQLVAGRQGPIGAARNLCAPRSRRARVNIGIRGQNGDLVRSRQKIHVRGCVRKSRARGRR